MTGWKPIVLAPVLAVGAWWAAYDVARERGAPTGDTTFDWLPLMPLFVGFLWLLLSVMLLFVRWSLMATTRDSSRVMAVLATAANVIGVAIIYGATITSVGGDGWPDDPVAVGALMLAGSVSLVPIAFVWRAQDRAPTSIEEG